LWDNHVQWTWRLIRRPADGPTSSRPSGAWCPPPPLKALWKPAPALRSSIGFYCYPVYAFIRRRGHGRQDAQDLTQDFFVHLLEKGTLDRADSQRGRFRSFLLGALDNFLAHAAERARAGKRGGGCQWVFLDDDAADRYQLAAPEGSEAQDTKHKKEIDVLSWSWGMTNSGSAHVGNVTFVR
jgi:hypothetical protein